MAAATFAEPPQYINYQGRLTDDTGEPITNTSPGVQMTFTIWNDPAASDPTNEEWTSGPIYVSVEDGLFEYQLGTLPSMLFRYYDDLWLGIKVGSDPELSPRTKLVSAAYACHAGTVDDIYVDEVGDAMTGDLLFDYDDNGETDGLFDVESYYSNIELYSDQALTAKLWGWEFGELQLGHNSDGLARADIAAMYNGGKLGLADNTGTGVIFLDGGSTGDNAAIFPEDAVNSIEILDEPGIVHSENISAVVFNKTSMSDIVTISITIPTDGYIFVMGRCTSELWGTTSSNQAYIQIDETAGGLQSGVYVLLGAGSFATATAHEYPVYVDRVYYKSAGTYEFRLEGMMRANANGSGDAYYSTITATFYPTSYASVKTISADYSDHAEAEAVTTIDPFTKAEKTMYEVDLRYYELKAKEAKIKALEAELELRQAEREAARGNR
jgi:hypothetical protein